MSGKNKNGLIMAADSGLLSPCNPVKQVGPSCANAGSEMLLSPMVVRGNCGVALRGRFVPEPRLPAGTAWKEAEEKEGAAERSRDRER